MKKNTHIHTRTHSHTDTHMHAHTHKIQWKEADQCVVFEFKSRAKSGNIVTQSDFSSGEHKIKQNIYKDLHEIPRGCSIFFFFFADVLCFVLTGPLCFESSAQPWDSNMVPASSSRVT